MQGLLCSKVCPILFAAIRLYEMMSGANKENHSDYTNTKKAS